MNSSTKHTNQIEIVSQPQSINIIEKVIDDLKNDFNIHEDAYGNILVAVTEAVNNAIVHGNNCDPNKNVFVSYEVDGDRVVVRVSKVGNLREPHARDPVTDILGVICHVVPVASWLFCAEKSRAN